MDHLFQAAREEPVGTSIGDVNQMLDNAAAGSGVSAGTGSTAWLGKGAIIKGGLFVGALAIGVVAFFMLSNDTQVEPVRVADITPIQAATADITDDQIIFPEQQVFIPQIEEQVVEEEEEATEELTEIATTQSTAPHVDQPILVNNANDDVPVQTTPNYHPEKKQKEANLNTVFVSGEMPEDPYGLLTQDDNANEDGEPVAAQPKRRIEQQFYLEYVDNDAELNKLQSDLDAVGMKIDVADLQRKWRKLRYIDLKFDWESVNTAEKTDCSLKASNFKFIQLVVEHDGEGKVSDFKIFVQGRQEYDVTTCGCQMNHR